MTEAPKIKRNEVELATKQVEVTKGDKNKGRFYFTLDWENLSQDLLVKHLGWDILKGWIKMRYNLIAQTAMWQSYPDPKNLDEGSPDIDKFKKFLEELSVTSETIEDMKDRIEEIVQEELPPVWAKVQSFGTRNMADPAVITEFQHALAAQKALSDEVAMLNKNIELRKEKYQNVGRKPASETNAPEAVSA